MTLKVGGGQKIEYNVATGWYKISYLILFWKAVVRMQGLANILDANAAQQSAELQIMANKKKMSGLYCALSLHMILK